MDKEELYVPGPSAVFGAGGSAGWEKPPRPPRRVIPKDKGSRMNVIALRRDLQYKPPGAEPVEVPDIFGGDITVETYVANVNGATMASLGGVGYKHCIAYADV